MANQLDGLLVDKRIVERNIKKQLLSQEALQKHLESLPDAAPNVDLVRVQSDEANVTDD